MYQIDEEWNFSYRECTELIPLMPLNGTSCRGMFSDLTNMATIDFSHFYTNNVVTMAGMFLDSTKLKELNLSSFDTSNVADMSCMFQLCESLTQVNLSSFNTYNVTDMSRMFASCENLHYIDVSHKWVINKCAKDDKVFDNCYKLPSYRDSHIGLEMCRDVIEGGYFHYIRKEDNHLSPVIAL